MKSGMSLGLRGEGAHRLDERKHLAGHSCGLERHSSIVEYLSANKLAGTCTV